ncbi:MAG: T9SS type A sorting domain-containing protein [Bacteroidia bacterium]
MTNAGGLNNFGCVFYIDTNGSGYRDLYDFNNIIDGKGKHPWGTLTPSGSVFYGRTQSGGTEDDGVVFKFYDITKIISINELTTSSSFVKLFPNPNNGEFTIQLSVISGQTSVEIYNMLVEKVYSLANSYQPMANSQIQIDLSNQPAGIYLYRVITESGDLISAGKFIIQK